MRVITWLTELIRNGGVIANRAFVKLLMLMQNLHILYRWHKKREHLLKLNVHFKQVNRNNTLWEKVNPYRSIMNNNTLG